MHSYGTTLKNDSSAIFLAIARVARRYRQQSKQEVTICAAKSDKRELIEN